MKLLSGFIFKFILLSAVPVYQAGAQEAQTAPAGSVAETQSDSLVAATARPEPADTTGSSFISRMEISFDYLKLLSFVFPAENKVEGGFHIVTKPNIGISFEAGYAAKMPEDHIRNADYKVEGLYYRFGLNYVFPFNPSTNFYIGARYGISNYQDEATYTIESSLWDPYQDSFSRTGLSAQWAEMIAGTEEQFRGNFYFGFIFRFRAMINFDNFDPVEVYAVPGYGRTMDKTVPALNLYIKYMIGFGK